VAYYLGVDGGGTKTLAVVTDQYGNVKGTGLAGNSNHQFSRKIAKAELKKAAEEAFLSSGIKQDMLANSCFGLAGADTPQDFDILHTILQDLGFESYSIYNDGLAALKAAELSFTGMTLICGTATNAIGRDAEGKFYQVGGFGYSFGDFGGGNHLSKEIFRLVIRSSEGREPETLLANLVKNELGFHSINEMYEHYIKHKKSIPAHLTPLLFEAAERGDLPANRLIEKQADELVLSVEALAEKMKLSAKPFTLVLAGSVITKSKNNFMYKAFLSKLSSSHLNANVKLLKNDPVIGSSLLAIGEKSIQEKKVKENLIQSLQSVKRGSDLDDQN
jgi:N-acetylglucosamine kinase-like BadF-type ATPase